MWYDASEVRKVRPLKQKVSLTLDPEVIDGINRLAEKSDRSFSQYVNMVLKREIKKQGQAHAEENE